MTRTIRHSRGFTLLEVIITIGVIAFLVGLLITGLTAMSRQSEIQRTKNTLVLLEQAVVEWEVAADRKLIQSDQPQAELSKSPPLPLVFVITEVMRAVRRNPDSAAILSKIDPDFVHTYQDGQLPPWIVQHDEELAMPDFEGEITVLDAWNVPIYATHPGQPIDETVTPRDDDGTERTYNESLYGSARSRKMFFVSAGPDRLFGHYREFPGLPPEELYDAIEEARRDNVYTYDPIFAELP